jgi:hypothetical protein
MHAARMNTAVIGLEFILSLLCFYLLMLLHPPPLSSSTLFNPLELTRHPNPTKQQMEPSPESQHVTSSSSSFFFSYPPSRNPASLQSFLSGALRNGQIGGDPLQVSHASSESPIRIRTEVRVMRTHRTHHPTGLEREPEVASDPSVASQPASRSRNSHSSRSQTTTTRTAPTIAVKSEPESEEAPVRPNTRSRKRQHTEQSKSAASVLPPKKRKRAPKQPVQLKKPPPGSKSEEEDEKKPSAELTSCCCICMCDVEHEELALINGCEHQFCFGCIEKWAERENTCPLCKMRFNKIDRVNRRRKKGTKNTKKVKQRDQRSDLVPGAALEGLLGMYYPVCMSCYPCMCRSNLICTSCSYFSQFCISPPFSSAKYRPSHIFWGWEWIY